MARVPLLPPGPVWVLFILFNFVTPVVHEQSAPAARLEAKEEGEVYVPPKEVELVDRPLKLSAPVRTTTIVPLPRVPEPEPAKKATVSVSEEAVVRITGGDLPARKSLLSVLKIPGVLLIGLRAHAEGRKTCKCVYMRHEYEGKEDCSQRVNQEYLLGVSLDLFRGCTCCFVAILLA